MDREQEDLQFLSFFSIFKESFRIISSWKKIFSQITLTLILPLSFIHLAHIEISQLLFFKILHNESALEETQVGSTKYSKLSNIISSEWTAFWLFKFAYFTFFLVLALLSTSAVVYTIACIYTAKDITFKKVMSVVPKVWKRLMVTFLWSFVLLFLYHVVAGSVFVFWAIFLEDNTVGVLIGVVLLAFYLCGLVYINIVWHLASVVSVLEDVYGFKALKKSKNLIKGKMGISTGMFVVLSVCLGGIEVLFENVVVLGLSPNVGVAILVGIVCFLLVVMVILLGLVIETIIYFICKSYHHENIDKSSLADHLEVYLGEYVPLKAKDVQLEQFQV
ncbi:uncharacterized protein LOC123206436 [Mangifera indica]|uniref:uncharacterized protein LOC123206436 n=1 Tax=Mangifera indica TaxID=29780 RepID=UPI001CFBDB31|nr:uncharacterized protein LOC123206436 [Mangifera indica]